MLDIFVQLFWLALLMAPGALLKRWVSLYLHALGFIVFGTNERAIWLRFLVMAPGIFLHELSHWLTAKLLLVRTKGFSLGPQKGPRKGMVTMGSVQIVGAGPIRGSLIGLAPFVFGTIVIVLLAEIGFRQALGPIRPPIERLTLVLTRLPELFRVQDAWLWMYLVFSVGNSLMPSESDRREWGTVLLWLAAIAVIGVLIVGVPQIPNEVLAGLGRVLDALLFAFCLTLIVDVVIGVSIFLLYQAISLLTGKQVRFR